MRRLLLLILILPLYVTAQNIPDYGFNKIRIADGDKIIQAQTLPVTSKSALKADRYYYWVAANAIQITEGGYSGKLLNGTYNEYFTSKNLKEQGSFKKGLKDGIWKTWTKGGSLIASYTWDEGYLSGPYNLYDSEGHLKQAGRYKNNILVKPDSVSFWKKLNIFKKKK